MGLSSVLVSVKGDASDDDVVKLACELLKSSSKSQLHILYVIEVERALPVDAEIAPATAKGEEVLKHIEGVAKPYKYITQAELLQSRQAGYAVVQEAVDRHVDAIVLGAPYMKQNGAYSMGKTIPYVLEHAPCKVVLWRERMPNDRTANRIQA